MRGSVANITGVLKRAEGVWILARNHLEGDVGASRSFPSELLRHMRSKKFEYFYSHDSGRKPRIYHKIMTLYYISNKT